MHFHLLLFELFTGLFELLSRSLKFFLRLPQLALHFGLIHL